MINGAFEFGAGCVTLLDVRAVLRDKAVRGVDWRVTGFFIVWGIYNLAFYLYLGQWFSWVGGIFVTVVNLLYAVFLLRYRKWRPT